MKNNATTMSAYTAPRILAYLLCTLGVSLALLGISGPIGTAPSAKGAVQTSGGSIQFGTSYHNDESLPLRDLANLPYDVRQKEEGPENPKLPNFHVDSPDPVIQGSLLHRL